MYFASVLRDAVSRRNGTRAEVPRMVYFIGLTSMLTDVASEMIASTLPVYLFTVLMLSPLQVGFLDGLYQGGAAVLRVFAGYFADKLHNNKAVAFVGYLLSTLARVGLLFSTTAGMLLAAISLFFDRVGKAIRTAPRDALIAGHTPAEHQGIAFGVHRAMDAVGAFLGPLIAAIILWLLPQRFDVLLIVSLVIGMLGLFVLMRYVKEPLTLNAAISDRTKEEADKLGNQDESKTSTFETSRNADQTKSARSSNGLSLGIAMRSLRKSKSFIRLTALASLLSLFTISDGLLYVALQKKIGFENQVVPMLFVATALIFLVFAPVVGRYAQRIGYAKTFLYGYLGLMLAYAWVSFFNPTGWLDVGIVVLLFGLFYAATDGVLAILTVRSLPIEIRTTGLAVIATVVALTKIASSTLFGMLWQAAGERTATLVFTGGLFVCIIVAIAILKHDNVALVSQSS